MTSSLDRKSQSALRSEKVCILMIVDFGRFMTPVLHRPKRSGLERVDDRLFDGNSAIWTTAKNAFVLFHDELLMVYKPSLVITDLEKLRVEFGTGSTANAQAVIDHR